MYGGRLALRRAVASLAAIVVLVVVAGCASEPSGLTLVKTKSPVQLLRNEAWYRLPDVMLKGDAETTDVSVACDADPDGLLRSWKSSTTALINNSFAPRTDGVADALALTFEDQGWTDERTSGDSTSTILLSKPGSVATISIEAIEKTPEHRASIRITTAGPCVETGGANSDEVRQLEGRE